jgi:putative acyl-CoA dehydrogenase
MARALQGAELLRHSTPEVAEAFVATRLAPTPGTWGAMLGTIACGLSTARADRIVERACVVS